jgi:hypothetical protein
LPELHAHDADGGIGHHFGQPDELEIQCAEGGVGVLNGRRDEPSDEVSVVVACSVNRRIVRSCRRASEIVFSAAMEKIMPY